MWDKEWFTSEEAADILNIPKSQIQQVVAERNMAVMWRRGPARRLHLLVKAGDLRSAVADLANQDRQLPNL
jgi:hypothetical protein